MNEERQERAARMVDVTNKDVTERTAVASVKVTMAPETRDAIRAGRLDKGDALEVARVAGIMGAKKTADLIPLCHPIGITSVDVQPSLVDEGVEIVVTVKTTERTGVEMEALTGAAAAALTVYDMVKSIERGVAVTDLRLVKKSGGRSGDWSR